MGGGGSLANNLIGGDDLADGEEDGVVKARNVIAGNREEGVTLAGSGVISNVVQGNLIGLEQTGDTPLGNGRNGVLLTKSIDEASGDSGAPLPAIGSAALPPAQATLSQRTDGMAFRLLSAPTRILCMAMESA